MNPSTPLAILPSGPVRTMDEAVARMQAIAALLPPADGLACFNRMYLLVTEAVRQRVTNGFFADPDFMIRMDVEFVNRYLAAVDAYQREPSSAPRAWRVLFVRRSSSEISPLQFALAGMNAHINFDLAAALVKTCEDLRTEPERGAHHADFEKVNSILADLEQDVRQSFEQGLLLELDRQFVGLENIATTFGIVAARETAWINAQVLWRIRDERLLFDGYLDGIDRSVAFAGRTVLVPLPRL